MFEVWVFAARASQCQSLVGSAVLKSGDRKRAHPEKKPDSARRPWPLTHDIDLIPPAVSWSTTELASASMDRDLPEFFFSECLYFPKVLLFWFMNLSLDPVFLFHTNSVAKLCSPHYVCYFVWSCWQLHSWAFLSSFPTWGNRSSESWSHVPKTSQPVSCKVYIQTSVSVTPQSRKQSPEIGSEWQLQYLLTCVLVFCTDLLFCLFC